jgi:hypothetical protein
MINFIKTAKNLLLKIAGTSYSIPSTDPNVPEILDAIRSGATEEEILDKVDVRNLIRKECDGTSFDIDPATGAVIIDGGEIPTSLGRRLTEYSDLGLGDRAKALVAFWNNVKKNPDERIRNDLFNFLSYNNVPITLDGFLVTYKCVKRNDNGDLVDCRTGKFLNNPGCYVKMPREGVDPDPRETCSAGLHVAAYDYANTMYPGYVMISCKVNPVNCVAVPLDHSNQKMRVCEYEVLEILEDRQIHEKAIVSDYDMFIRTFSTSDMMGL